jgi:predicted ATPase
MRTRNNLSQLTGIYVEKFQSIKDGTYINLDGLVFIVGPNSAGKSSLIDAIELIRLVVRPNKTKFHPDFWLYENRNKEFNGSPTIGVEIKVGSAVGGYYITSAEERNNIDVWEKSCEDVHEFFKSIAGKKIQVDFSGEFDTIRIAIDSVPLVEIIEHSEILFNNFDVKCSQKEEDSKKFDDNYIYGKIIIYKNNIHSKELFVSSLGLSKDMRGNGFYENNFDNNHHYPLFVEEDAETITIYGINFGGSRKHDENLVHLGYFVDSILLNRWIGGVFPTARSRQNKSERFLYDMFHQKSENYKENRRRRLELFWRLESAAKEVNDFIQGLFFYIADAIEISHVKGERALLSSKRPFHVDPVIAEGFDYIPSDKNIAEYANQLVRKFDERKFEISNYLHKTDFINISFGKYLKSLRPYKIVPTVYFVKEKYLVRGKGFPSKHEIIFLKIKDENNNILGLENVGSGISFILPILAALWNSHFTIVEQPELHLHPSAQCELGDVFLAARNGGSNALIETHSEHLILRVLRRIRETTGGVKIPNNIKINNSDVNIYYFEPLATGHTSVKQIRVDKFGELLDLWPGGFFSERDGELF